MSEHETILEAEQELAPKRVPLKDRTTLQKIV